MPMYVSGARENTNTRSPFFRRAQAFMTHSRAHQVLGVLLDAARRPYNRATLFLRGAQRSIASCAMLKAAGMVPIDSASTCFQSRHARTRVIEVRIARHGGRISAAMRFSSIIVLEFSVAARG
jgi:hypothetical protein